jgi:hypothetical protein
MGEWRCNHAFLTSVLDRSDISKFILLSPRGKSPQYPLDRKLSGPQNLSECGGEEKSPRAYRESKPGLLSRSLVTKLTELHRLPHSSSYFCYFYSSNATRLRGAAASNFGSGVVFLNVFCTKSLVVELEDSKPLSVRR